MAAVGKWIQLSVLCDCRSTFGDTIEKVRLLDQLCSGFYTDPYRVLPAVDVWCQPSQIGRVAALDRLAGQLGHVVVRTVVDVPNRKKLTHNT